METIFDYNEIKIIPHRQPFYLSIVLLNMKKESVV